MTTHANFTEDALRELELWSYLSLGQTVVAPAGDEAPPPARSPAAPAGAQPTAATPALHVPPLPPAAARPPTGQRRRELAPAADSKTAPVTIDPARAARIALLEWEPLAVEAAACQVCGLCRKRKQAVLGVGALQAPWLFVGEGPGAEEDEQGEPFVGAAGQLLDAMLAAAGLKRGREVYIANVVKCRPPGNRTPNADEAAACAPFLDRQIDLIRPKLIVALGKTAVTRLTGSEESMASMRGRRHQYRNIPVIATYHPAYLLRNLPDKVKAWEDLMLAKATFAGS